MHASLVPLVTLDRSMLHMLPIAGTSPFVVTTDDGTLFHCQPHEVSGEAEGKGRDASGARWILIDTQRVAHVGPAYDGQVAPQTLQRILSDWWSASR